MNTNKSDKYTKLKKLFALVTGVGVFVVSAIFSQTGFGFREPSMAWAGWALAIAVTVAELIFNTKVRNLNWTIIVVGIMAYVYSIYTNFVGFYALQGTPIVFWSADAIIPILGSIFMDVYPEMAVAWAMDAAGDGDLIGNVVEVSSDPENIFRKPIQSQKRPQPQHSPYVPKNKPQLGALNQRQQMFKTGNQTPEQIRRMLQQVENERNESHVSEYGA